MKTIIDSFCEGVRGDLCLKYNKSGGEGEACVPLRVRKHDK